jgi:transcriptional regulator with XRE-family HTH domain
MPGHECYHCKQWVEEGEPHDCWTTTEEALTRDLSEDLQETWERLRETAVEFGDQRIRTLETTPRGATHWSTRQMAKAVGLSHMAISRIWRAFVLQPHRGETFKLSSDPQLVEKVRDIVGLYLDPPAHAAVFCVDEKPQIQALERTQPLLPLQPARSSAGRTITHGTTRPPCSRRSTRRPVRSSRISINDTDRRSSVSFST